MNTIILPTDFSINSQVAAEYAVPLVNAFRCEFVLLHTYQVYSTSAMFVSVESYMKSDAAQQLLELTDKLQPQLYEGARITSKVVQGDPVPVIADVVNHSPHALLIMGTKGATGMNGIFMGSTTRGVLKRTDKAILVIPADSQFEGLKKIVLAIDGESVSHSGVLLPLLKLARHFKSEVHIYHKDTGKRDSGIDSSLELYLSDIEHSFHYEMDERNISESIHHFLARTGADLLCMIRRQRGFLAGLLHESATRKEVFYSPVPLLVLHDH